MADLEGNIPAHLAAAEGHLDCLRLLVYYKNEPEDVITSRNNRVRSEEDDYQLVSSIIINAATGRSLQFFHR